ISTSGRGLVHPRFNGLPHLAQAAFEEVISGFDADELLRLREGVDERFEFTRGAELIARSADEEFRLGARAQEFEIVDAVFSAASDGDGGQAEGDERAYTGVGVGGAQS